MAGLSRQKNTMTMRFLAVEPSRDSRKAVRLASGPGKRTATGNVHGNSAVAGSKSVIQNTKNEPVVGSNIFHRAKTLMRSLADTLVMDRRDEGS